MAFQFPAAPAIGQIFNPVAGIYYQYDGTGWVPFNQNPQLLTQFAANKIINGNFMVNQRNPGSAVNVAAGSVYPMDRHYISMSNAGQQSYGQVADPVYPGEWRGKFSVTVADAAVAAGDFSMVGQRIEGRDAADLNWGDADAYPLTIAFEIETSVAGTWPLAVRNSAANRSYVTTFATLANVRTPVVATIPGDTAGAWNITNGIGVDITIGYMVGTTFHAAAANAWSAGDFRGVAGVTNLVATVNATAAIRNFRAFRGSNDFGFTATPFVDNLAACQRYYEKTFAYGTLPAQNVGSQSDGIFISNVVGPDTAIVAKWYYRSIKRAVPTVTTYNPAAAATSWRDLGNTASVAVVQGASGTNGIVLSGTGVAGFAYQIHAVADAEL